LKAEAIASIFMKGNSIKQSLQLDLFYTF